MALLTNEDAVEIWLLKWKGEYIKRISAQFDIDPRRIYEILTEEKFPGSRLEALNRFRRDLPSLAARTNTDPHVAKLHVVRRDPDQGELFG
ncbi:hypothetical protein [Bosea sp. CRIB-10]|uniref:hypothetical protein n=1 Tax=Bosea sp. CRIB-10 TaxID=378404 RepID=UPI000B85FD13|nr:hypothetical protein [Bosea sp. CRIB-10]